MTASSATTILIAARSRLADPAAWFSGIGDAVDGYGHPVRPWRAEAVRWSVFGAWQVDSGIGTARAGVRAFEALTKATGGDPLMWNGHPGRTHAEVLAAFDTAVAALAVDLRPHPSSTTGDP